MPTIRLPTADHGLADYTTAVPRAFPKPTPPYSRIALAATHVVADPLADGDPWLAPARPCRTASPSDRGIDLGEATEIHP